MTIIYKARYTKLLTINILNLYFLNQRSFRYGWRVGIKDYENRDYFCGFLKKCPEKFEKNETKSTQFTKNDITKNLLMSMK